jgi:hypothetical protein
MTIAWFVTPHGLGHAARAAAIMASWARDHTSLKLHLFTTVPKLFFQESIGAPFTYHHLETDLGVVQRSALREDIGATVRRLDDFLPFDEAWLDQLAEKLQQIGCDRVVVDIAPLGLAVAQRAGIPSVLIENFTWDWIYEAYVKQDSRLQRHIDYLHAVFATATVHVQTTPVCHPVKADFVSAPVSRVPRQIPEQTRKKLGVPLEARVVLVTMGGIPEQCSCEEALATYHDLIFLLPGTGSQLERKGNLFFIPVNAGIYHPDLVAASDAVVGKLGYSTLSEVYYTGLPFAYICREHFRESDVLSTYAADQFNGIALAPRDYETGNWISCVPDLIQLSRRQRSGVNGADQVADFLARLDGA